MTKRKVLPSWRVLLHPCWEHYQRPGNEAGGYLHVVLDDGNVDSNFILTDLEEAEERGDGPVVELCQLLLRASMTQREKLYNHYAMYCWRADEPENIPEVRYRKYDTGILVTFGSGTPAILHGSERVVDK